MSMNDRNNNTTRPRKSGTAKNRRMLEHKKKLLALGVPEAKVRRLDAKQLRWYVQKPQLVKELMR